MNGSDLLILLITGLIAGFSSGLIGVGGGIFYVVIYSIFLEKLGVTNEHEFVRMVIANSIFSTLFAALAASYKQIRLKNFYPKYVLLIGLPGALAAIGLTQLINRSEWYDKTTFSVVFTLAMLPLIGRMIMKSKKASLNPEKLSNPFYLVLGLFSGMATALSGLGGAFLMTPVLNGWRRVNIKKVVSIAVGVIVIVAFATSVFNLFTQDYQSINLDYTYGGINLGLSLPIIIGVLVAAPFGVTVSNKLSNRTIKLTFAAFCILVVIYNLRNILLG